MFSTKILFVEKKKKNGNWFGSGVWMFKKQATVVQNADCHIIGLQENDLCGVANGH